MTTSAQSERIPTGLLTSIFLISAAALAYELLLMRLFSIVQWQHFATMIISLALLGFGVSGAILTIFSDSLLRRFEAAYLINALLLGPLMVGCFTAAQRIGFNSLELLWDPAQWGRLVVVYLILSLPFFCAANCICLCVFRYRQSLHSVYAVDLIGASAGALGIVLVLYAVLPVRALQLLGGIALLAAGFAWFALAPRARWAGAVLSVGLALALAPIGDSSELRPVEFKALSQMLEVSGTRVLAERSSPLGLVTVVESSAVPLRHAPGLSLLSPAIPNEQLAMFTDGDGLTAITRLPDDIKKLAWLEAMPTALPYHLLERPSVALLGTGGGMAILQALYHGSTDIHAVELNPQVVDLVGRRFGEFSGKLYGREDVTVHLAEARSHIERSERDYDLIQIEPLDAFNTSSAGLYAANESYVYTVEAFAQYLHSLGAGGILSVTRWVRAPPREELKLFATAVQAARAAGLSPERSMIWLRSWNTSTLLVKKGALTSEELSSALKFSKTYGFDLDYAPGLVRTQANRYHRQAGAIYYDAAQVLLGESADRFIDAYKFNIAPATDNRPYFFHFYQWKTLGELAGFYRAGGLSLIDLGYVVALATLAQAAAASLLLILLPVAIASRRVGGKARKLPTLIYFSSIGAGFIVIEVAFIQKLILYLAHPIQAVAVVLAGFLLFAGLGSALSRRAARWGMVRLAAGVVGGIAVLCILYLYVVPVLLASLQSTPLRIAAALVLIAPLGVLMGMPFPLGMKKLCRTSALVSWAWGVNGCASVVGAVAAGLLAMHLGIAAVIAIGVGLYAVALLVLLSSSGSGDD